MTHPTGRRVAIITGGASGIGRSIAEELARRDFEVVVADRQIELAHEVAALIRGHGGHAEAVEVDVRSFESLQRAVQQTTARTGRLDYFFNNAGISVAGEIDSYTLADWDDVFDVNLRGVAYGVQAAYPIMIAQGFGHIVNTASIAGLVPLPGQGSYTATKHAIVGLSKTLRIEAARHGVRVSVMCPGLIRTPLLTGGKYGRANAQEQDRPDPWESTAIAPEQFARGAVKAVLRNAAVIVIPRWWKLFWYFDFFCPGLSFWIAARAVAQSHRALPAP